MRETTLVQPYELYNTADLVIPMVLIHLTQRSPVWAVFSFAMLGKVLGHVVSRKLPNRGFTLLHLMAWLGGVLQGGEGASRLRRVLGTLLSDALGTACVWRMFLVARHLGVPGCGDGRGDNAPGAARLGGGGARGGEAGHGGGERPQELEGGGAGAGTGLQQSEAAS